MTENMNIGFLAPKKFLEIARPLKKLNKEVRKRIKRK